MKGIFFLIVMFSKNVKGTNRDQNEKPLRKRLKFSYDKRSPSTFGKGHNSSLSTITEEGPQDPIRKTLKIDTISKCGVHQLPDQEKRTELNQPQRKTKTPNNLIKSNRMLNDLLNQPQRTEETPLIILLDERIRRFIDPTSNKKQNESCEVLRQG
ncbi:hypothetical protein NGRA_1068 [Nosema granulosis]|uniref:Uncharacterized protein n=1 Tax=Nosema granulosis TaxID=83296 RepID=A0A9P6GZ65_9MICR|nr:hypothetical protein NGRA_1068 [Nosema granulosis]